MDHAQILIGMAEVAVGVAGFAGIVFVLAGRQRHSGRVVRVLVGMLINSVVTVLLSLIGIALASAYHDDVFVWGYASSAGLLLAATAVPLGLADRKIAAQFDDSKVSAALGIPLFLVGLVAPIVLHAFNLPMFGEPTFTLFFVATACLLATAVAEFMYLIYQLVNQSANETPP